MDAVNAVNAVDADALGVFERGVLRKIFGPVRVAVCCDVRGRALGSHTGVRGFEPQCGGPISGVRAKIIIRVGDDYRICSPHNR